MRRTLGLLLALALAMRATSGAAADGQAATTPEGAARAFAEALRAGNETAAAATAGDAELDPFLVALSLLGAPDPPAGTSSLDLAAAFSDRAKARRDAEGLDALVTRWRARSPEKVAAGRGVLSDRARLREAADRNDRPTADGLVAAWVSARGAAPADAESAWMACEAARWWAGGGHRGVDAESAYREVAEAANTLRWPRLRARALRGAGETDLALGRPSKAVEAFSTEREILESVGDAPGAAGARHAAGCATELCGDYVRALAEIERARAEFVSAGRPVDAAIADRSAARVLGRMGRFSEGLARIEKARSTLDAAGDRREAAVTLAWEGAIFGRMGDVDRAAEYYRKGMAALPSPASAADRGSLLADLGLVYARAHRVEEAEQALREALPLLEATGEEGLALRVDAALVDIESQQGRFQAAVDRAQKAVAGLESLGQALHAARVRGNAGEALVRLGRGAEAKEGLARSIETLRSLGDHEGLAISLLRLGEVHQALEEYPDALRVLEAAKAEWEAVGDRALVARTLRQIAAAQGRMGLPSRALKSLRRAVDMLLSLGAGLSESEAAGSREATRDATDDGLVEAWWALRLERSRSAAILADTFWFAEAGRGLLLAEALSDRRSLLSAGVSPEAAAADQSARAALKARQAELSDFSLREDADPAGLSAARKNLDDAYRGVEDAVSRVQRESRRTGDMVFPRPRPLAEVQRALPEGTALVLFQLGRRILTSIVVRKDGVAYTQPSEEKDILRELEAYAREAASGGALEAAHAARLYSLLIAPIEPELKSAKRVLISPDGVLAFLPFAALVRTAGERPERMIDRWEIGYVPSGSVYAALVEDAGGLPPGRGLVAAGDPVYPGESLSSAAAAPPAGAATRDAGDAGFASLARIPATGDEVRAIGALFPQGERTLLLRERASAEGVAAAIASRPGRIRALHLACHGHLDPAHPRLSGLALSGGSVLTLDDVCRMSVPADLAVLSACETGKGRVEKGEGVAGLTRGFMYAGAPRVLVSLWTVDDAATRMLMERFYVGWTRDGLGAAAALRAAQFAVRDVAKERTDPEASRKAGRDVAVTTRPYADPRFWAGWALWGLPE